MLPAIVVTPRKADVDKRPPLRSLRFANQLNSRLMRQPVAFSRVAWNTRTHNVLPSRLTSTVSREDVIKIQFVPLKNLAAVLTGVSVALEHIVPGKFDFLLRQPLEKQ